VYYYFLKYILVLPETHIYTYIRWSVFIKIEKTMQNGLKRIQVLVPIRDYLKLVEKKGNKTWYQVLEEWYNMVNKER